MEGCRKIVESVLFGKFVVLAHCVKQCLFVANDVVVFEMVVYSQFRWIDLYYVLFLQILPTWK